MPRHRWQYALPPSLSPSSLNNYVFGQNMTERDYVHLARPLPVPRTSPASGGDDVRAERGLSVAYGFWARPDGLPGRARRPRS